MTPEAFFFLSAQGPWGPPTEAAERKKRSRLCRTPPCLGMGIISALTLVRIIEGSVVPKKNKKWFERQQKHRSGWWCNFTILKFDGLRQMGVWHSQYDGNVIPSSDPDLGIHGEAVLNNNPTTTSLVAWHTSKCISWVLCMWLTLHLSFKN